MDAYVCSFCLLIGCLGCSAHTATPEREPAPALGPNAPCSFLMLSQVGIDPSSLAEHAEPSLSPIQKVQRTAKSFGKTLTRVSLKEYLEVAETVGAAILEARDGQLHVILGEVTIDGERYFQLIGQRFQPQLVPLSTLLDELSVNTVWLAKAQPGTVIRIKVGNAVVGVDKLWHNFGLSKPFAESSTTFRFTNEGDSPLQVEYISTSCGCTVAEFEDGTVLRPGQGQELLARVSTAGQTGFEQTITLRIVDPATEVDRPLVLALFGNQVPVMSVSPGSVDFGILRKEDSPVVRSVRLSQTVHDRFRVKQVVSPDLPISSAIHPEKAGDQGLSQDSYKITLRLDPSALEPGLHQSTVDVMTTSRFRPVVEVPVALKIRYHVEAVPSVAAFGLITENCVKEERIRLISTDGSSFSARVLSSPEDCEVAIESNNDSVVLLVRPHFQKGGAYQRRLAVEVSSDDWVENLEVECAAFVKLRR